ncbi:hypothetical protein EKI60_04625 [Candidatus Saccharibacteria bacterium]|nr:MAG: hypothetical protein EKI60_04625 [Candidatus Saccharibacteria bacterium]
MKPSGKTLSSEGTAKNALRGSSEGLYAAFGEVKSLRDWLTDERCRVSESVLKSRMRVGVVQPGDDIENLLTQPKRNATLYTAFGESKPWPEWRTDPRFTVNENSARYRLKSGWEFEKAISVEVQTLPEYSAFGESKTLKEWLLDNRSLVDEKNFHLRRNLGWPIEKILSTPIRKQRTLSDEYQAFGESKTISEWLKDDRCLASRTTIYRKLDSGDSFEEILRSTVPEFFYDAYGESKTAKEWLDDDRCSIDNVTTLVSRFNSEFISNEDALTEPPCYNVSHQENSLADFISRFIDIERSNRSIIAPYELDIFIPSMNMAVEYNGLYWHSEKFKHRNYHYDKYIACKEKGIRLIQIWEDDWILKRPVVEKMVLNRLGLSDTGTVYARKTTVDKEVSLGEAKKILTENHIQGFTTASYRYGLRDSDGTLVAVLLMKRLSGEVKWDLVRYATSCNVPGGFSKLLKAFRSDHDGAIKTFADISISNGHLYRMTGFREIEVLAPDYHYVKPTTLVREHKFRYRKERFKLRDDLEYVEGLTESELASLNGLYKVYDAGKIKFSLV